MAGAAAPENLLPVRDEQPAHFAQQRGFAGAAVSVHHNEPVASVDGPDNRTEVIFSPDDVRALLGHHSKGRGPM